MDERIKLNNDKTIRFIVCKECGYHISFVDQLVLEDLKNVTFDCIKCSTTQLINNGNVITLREQEEKFRLSLINSFNKIFRRRN